MPDPGDLEAVAHLVGATNAQLRNMDSQIVSTSTNLQTSNENWDPKAVITAAAQDLQLAPQGVPQAVPQGVPQAVPQPEPMQVPASPAYVPQQLPTFSPDSLAVLLRIEQKLDLYMERIQKIETIGSSIDKSIERGLKSKFKQVTIKFDDSTNTK